MTTPKLALPELSTSQSGKEITHNQALAVLDQLVQAGVVDKDLSAPPGSPADGSLYIVASSPTGAWAGHAKDLAYWISSAGGWSFVTPREGFWVHVNDEDEYYKYSGSVWEMKAVSGMANPMTAAGDLISGGVSGAPQRLAAGANGQRLTMVSGAPAWANEKPQCIPIACSDETTALTAGTAKVAFRMPFAMTVTAVRASLTAAQASGAIFTVDINEGGTSILSTKLTIDNTEKTSTTAAIAAVISDASLADDAEITIDIDQIGDGTAKGLKIYLIGVPA